MQINQQTIDNKAVISLSGRFDFNTHREFRSAYEDALKAEGIKALEMNLSGVDYLDSSALGMLLMLKERATARNVQISISNCQNSVKQILDIANFSKLFTIS